MKNFSNKLLRWFEKNGRKDLPWQTEKTPYRIWVSEIMLQQTQVKTVIPFFNRFFKRFKSVHDLADASLDEVLHYWSGLGYYARARNLHRTAKIISDELEGEFPASQEGLAALPGVGRSTAGAILAISSGKKATILDGNVKRVLSRIKGFTEWPGVSVNEKKLWDYAEQLTPDQRVADYTQAIMDLGATLCTRSKPKCNECPFLQNCKAYDLGIVEKCPGRKPKKTIPTKEVTMILAISSGRFLLEKRDKEGLWGGLWTLPQCDADDLKIKLEDLLLTGQEFETLPVHRHSFSHYHLDITPVRIKAKKTPPLRGGKVDYLWIKPNGQRKVGIPKPTEKLMEKYLC